jgi:hypothetical protein
MWRNFFLYHTTAQICRRMDNGDALKIGAVGIVVSSSQLGGISSSIGQPPESIIRVRILRHWLQIAKGKLRIIIPILVRMGWANRTGERVGRWRGGQGRAWMMVLGYKAIVGRPAFGFALSHGMV